MEPPARMALGLGRLWQIRPPRDSLRDFVSPWPLSQHESPHTTRVRSPQDTAWIPHMQAITAESQRLGLRYGEPAAVGLVVGEAGEGMNLAGWPRALETLEFPVGGDELVDEGEFEEVLR